MLFRIEASSREKGSLGLFGPLTRRPDVVAPTRQEAWDEAWRRMDCAGEEPRVIRVTPVPGT